MKKMYDDEGMATPSEADLQEMFGMPMSDGDQCYVPSYVFSFGSLDEEEAAQEIVDGLNELISQYTAMVQNIIYFAEGDKAGLLRTLSDEFISRMDGVLSGKNQNGETQPAGGAPGTQPVAEAAAEPIKFAESGGSETVLEESAGAQSDVLLVDTVLVQPGWGNIS